MKDARLEFRLTKQRREPLDRVAERHGLKAPDLAPLAVDRPLDDGVVIKLSGKGSAVMPSVVDLLRRGGVLIGTHDLITDFPVRIGEYARVKLFQDGAELGSPALQDRHGEMVIFGTQDTVVMRGVFAQSGLEGEQHFCPQERRQRSATGRAR
jgi:hypothetical protein